MILCVAQLLEKIEERRKNNRCCQEFRHRSQRCSRLWKSFKTTGMCSRRHGGRVVLKYDACRRQIYRPINQKEQAHHSSSAGGKPVSCCLGKRDLPKTVARRWRERGLYARRPVMCVPLTRQHRTARLQWCRASQLD
ncbi:hypothetical protein TNCV_76781 [Trichonephila clavipes]|nr:hypothetical protein TNCV_76781 [Trichonephila clavipes]